MTKGQSYILAPLLGACITVGSAASSPAQAQKAPAKKAPAKKVRVLKNRKVTTTKGKIELLARGHVTALLFFCLDKEYSMCALREIETLRRRLAKQKKAVRFIGIISSRYGKQKIKAKLQEAKIGMTVAYDDNDKLYGELGVKMRPTIALIDKRRRLVAWQVYRKVNFKEIVRAQVRFALGEISRKELQHVLSPTKRSVGTGGGKHIAALRQWRLGKMLLGAGALPGALRAAKKAVGLDEKLARAHLLLGQILAKQKKCARAKKAFGKALALDPKLAAAKAGRATCR